MPGTTPSSSDTPFIEFLPLKPTQEPIFDYRLPTNVTVSVGQTAFLKCKVFARENRTVSIYYCLERLLSFLNVKINLKIFNT